MNKKNTSAFTEEDIGHLTSARNISALKNTKPDNNNNRRGGFRRQNPGYIPAPQYQSQQQFQPQFQPRYGGFQPRPRYQQYRAPDTNWRNVESMSFQPMPSRKPFRDNHIDQGSQQQQGH